MQNPIETPIGRVQPLYRGNYSSSSSYEKLDNVLYNGNTYIALQTVPKNKIPGASTSSRYWQLIAKQGNTGGFGTPIASASSLATGTPPTVTVTASGPDTAKIFDFNFGIPAGPTGPVGFDTVSASASIVATTSPATVTVTKASVGSKINLDFNFGIPAADGTGVAKVDGYGPTGTSRNVILNAVSYGENQELNGGQQKNARENINALSAGLTINSQSITNATDTNASITLTPTDISAVHKNLKINNKTITNATATNASITLTPNDIGAVAYDTTQALSIAQQKNALKNIGAVSTSFTINGVAFGTKTSMSLSEIGAVPTSRTINSKGLNSNITLTAADVGAVNASLKINSKTITNATATNASITLTPADISAIHENLTINGKSITNATATNASITTRTIASGITVSTSAWSSSSTPSSYTMAGYPYQAVINIQGVNDQMIPQVNFDLNDSMSGIFAPIAATVNNGVQIYASNVPENNITIPTIICFN